MHLGNDGNQKDRHQVAEMFPNVSRETFDRLEIYVSLLREWNGKINLVSPRDMDQIWQRHIVDSLQLVTCLNTSVKSIVDLGSGGGFPGIVLALATDVSVTLIESDLRKTVFLKEVLRQTQNQANVICQRIEKVQDIQADVITARALAPLDKLLSFAKPKLKTGGYCLFLKGRQADLEIDNARKDWKMDIEKIPSQTSEDGVILKINQFERVE